MDCRTARLLFEFARPRANELPHPEAAELRHHLDACPECSALAAVERRTDHHLARAMRDVPVPVGLRNRLLERLKADSVPTRSRWLLRTVATVGVAAALLLGVGLWAMLARSQPTRLDIAGLQGLLAAKTTNPNADWVEAWFQDTHGVVMVAPRAFGQNPLDYSLLLDYDLVTLPNGRLVPKLVFVSGKERLVVYVLSDRQFRVVGTEEESLGWKSEMFDAEDAPFTHLLFYTGGRLSRFCLHRPAV